MTTARVLRLGTRRSKLALCQARIVADALEERGWGINIVEVTTVGDIETTQPIDSLGGTGIFTSAIQQALLAGEIDLAVHSLKDLPVDTIDGLMLAAVPVRADPADALSATVPYSIADLPVGSRVGTSSARRRAQILHARPDLVPTPVRGNVETRLHKLDTGEYDALILAVAGLERLDLKNRITERLSLDTFTPAAGQGALGVETRADDRATIAALQAIDDVLLRAATTAERAVLAALSAGCLTAVGTYCRANSHTLRLVATVLSTDGTRRILETQSGPLDSPIDLGQRVADSLLVQGAAELLA